MGSGAGPRVRAAETLLYGGTNGSNPAPSSGESVSAVNPGAVCEKPRSLAAVCV
jgi:hypothetical protein